MKAKTADGNSGGPVLNRNSKVIGIAVSSEAPYSHAIPVNILKMLLDQAQAIEPLAQWRERKEIRAYACLVQSKIKHKINNNDETMIADLDKAIQLNPDFFLSHVTRGNMKVSLAHSKAGEGNVEIVQRYCRDAIDDYTHVIRLYPDYAPAYDGRGSARSQLGQSKTKEGNIVDAQQHYQDAIGDHTEAIKLCSDYDSAYNNRSDVKCYFGKSEDVAGNVEAAHDLYQEAIIDINTAIELDFSVPIFYHTRGEIMYALGDYRVAIENYEIADEKDPDYTHVCKGLELAKEALEQQEKTKN